MNKNVIVMGLVVLLLLVGAGIFMTQRAKNTPAGLIDDSRMLEQGATGETTRSDSLRSLMTLADRKQCTFSDPETGSSGTVYASGDQVRGDFQSSVDDVMTDSHMYTDGKDMYIWIDGQTAGFKMALAAVEGATDTFSQSVDLDKPVDYSCQNWSVNLSMFELPNDVNFTDPTSMMPNEGLPRGIDAPQVSCSACDSL